MTLKSLFCSANGNADVALTIHIYLIDTAHLIIAAVSMIPRIAGLWRVSVLTLEVELQPAAKIRIVIPHNHGIKLKAAGEVLRAAPLLRAALVHRLALKVSHSLLLGCAAQCTRF